MILDVVLLNVVVGAIQLQLVFLVLSWGSSACSARDCQLPLGDEVF